MKKPILVNKERFIESVYHLSFFGNILDQINYTKGNFTFNFSDKQIQQISFSIQWNILIITQSLMDELNKFLFNYKPDEIDLINRIKAYKCIITPALEEIKKWEDIRDFRNHVLAHNGRNYEGLSVILSDQFKNYNIPIYHNDFLILFQLLKIITEKAAEIFSEEQQEAEKIMARLPAKQKNRKYKVEIAIEKVNNIIAEMNKRSKRYNETSK
jgi:hypothetical protein